MSKIIEGGSWRLRQGGWTALEDTFPSLPRKVCWGVEGKKIREINWQKKSFPVRRGETGIRRGTRTVKEGVGRRYGGDLTVLF